MHHYNTIQEAAIRAQMLVGGLGQYGVGYFDPFDAPPLNFHDFRANKSFRRKHSNATMRKC